MSDLNERLSAALSERYELESAPGTITARTYLLFEELGTRNFLDLIVSQGQVAASGGYWISMYGNRIVATPMTITGSIGVIAGWLWNRDFGDKVGFSFDSVRRGEHADFGKGIRLPFLGIMLAWLIIVTYLPLLSLWWQ